MAPLDSLGDVATAAAGLKTAFSAIREVLGLVKDVKDTLPEGEKKNAISQGIEKAERASKIAEAQMASGLGFALCRRHFPPEIMLETGYANNRRQMECPVCHHTWPPSVERPSKSKVKSWVQDY
jgi:hypothetical protein